MQDNAPRHHVATETGGSTPAGETHRSLFGGILDWMLIPLLLLWPLSIAVTYIVAKSIANEPFDRALEDKLNAIAQQVRMQDAQVITRLNGPARDILHADNIDNLYYQIIDKHGRLVEGEADIPAPRQDDPLSPWAVQFRHDFVRNVEMRIAYTYIDLFNTRPNAPASNESGLILVQVGETLEKRSLLANQIIKGVIMPQFIILPLALILIWFALTRGLRPLAELQQRINERSSDDLSPIDSGHVPEEIMPLVGSLNDMLDRLSHNIRTQKRFIADAAHQMKTPLAGMRMQSELALRQKEQTEIHKSLEQLAKSSSSATRLVNQLLALARAENPLQESGNMQRLDLCELARETMQDWIPMSFNRRIDLGLESPEHAVHVQGDPVMLRELLNNLIDNALNYTPEGGHATVRIRIDPLLQRGLIEVEDTGPGIAVHEHVHIFDRFYRILGSNVEGSGLGLSIVREIAQQHAADIDILENPHCRGKKLPGCLMRVSLPLSREENVAEQDAP